ncbi:hypothetical protein QAD02_002757 [Eretmocerus hayati]|uniref:Uncharacterized protein n=1 Tax=Eretmocerus hayati TaxID=131215 RepID=A0ACC2NJX7_9HYME|nr:hypothetical protein QAD02_002757 [Eretmocerus hayati]
MDSSPVEPVEGGTAMVNFSDQARLIVEKDTLPEKSADLLSEDVVPTMLWSIWSMLRKTLGTREDVDLSRFLSLKSFVKNTNKGYKPKKAAVFRWNHIMRFMTEAPERTELAKQVILIYGICGCLRCDGILNIKVKDVEDLGDKLLVSVNDNKNEYSGQFIIGPLFYQKVKKYMVLRRPHVTTDRFFIKYVNGECFNQPIGIHKIGEVPSYIAKYLGLPNQEEFTGHSLRRTSATLVAQVLFPNAQVVSTAGNFATPTEATISIINSTPSTSAFIPVVIPIPSCSDQSLLRNDIVTETDPLLDLIQPDDASAPELKSKESTDPETSLLLIQRPDESSNNEFQVDWSDFAEDFDKGNSSLTSKGVSTTTEQKIIPVSESFDSTSLNQSPSKNVQVHFVIAKNKQICIPTTLESKPNSANKKFFNKPSVTLDFGNQSNDPTPTLKKRRLDNCSTNQTNNNVTSRSQIHTSEFDDCCFRNCQFNDCNYAKNVNKHAQNENNNVSPEPERDNTKLKKCTFDNCVFDFCDRTG